MPTEPAQLDLLAELQALRELNENLRAIAEAARGQADEYSRINVDLRVQLTAARKGREVEVEHADAAASILFEADQALRLLLDSPEHAADDFLERAARLLERASSWRNSHLRTGERPSRFTRHLDRLAQKADAAEDELNDTVSDPYEAGFVAGLREALEDGRELAGGGREPVPEEIIRRALIDIVIIDESNPEYNAAWDRAEELVTNELGGDR